LAKKKTEQEIPAEDVWDVLQFANALSSLYPSAYSPQLLNSRLKDLTTIGVGEVTEKKVEQALLHPKDSERELLGISETLEYSSTSYKRIIDYISNLPAWDLTYYCKNVKKPADYKSKEYHKSLDVMKDFFYKFDYKREFATAVKQLFREETFFTVLRDEGEKFTLQQLPSDYCLITGRWDYGLLFSFNYMFFQQSGIDIDMFPEIFAKTYVKLFKDARGNSYNPSISVDERANSTWVLWGDCSPMDNFWGWKLQPQNALRVPYFAGLFPDFAMQNLIRGLQKNSYIASAAKIIFGQVGMNKDTKANVRDSINISPKLLGEFLQLVKAGINNEAIKVASAPLEDIQPVEFTNDNEIYSSWLHTTLGAAGINASLLFSGDVKQNSIESMLSSNIDEMVATTIYPYFNNFMDYHVNKRLKDAKSEYRFGFNFEGTNFYLDRQRRLEVQTGLMSSGIVLPQSISAAIGKDPFAFQAQLDEARINGWVDDLTPVIAAAQMAGNAKGNGRPSKSDSDLSESGEVTRDAGSNIAKGGKK